jgi:hypothetical protein
LIFLIRSVILFLRFMAVVINFIFAARSQATSRRRLVALYPCTLI